jgi:hypothetical protein
MEIDPINPVVLALPLAPTPDSPIYMTTHRTSVVSSGIFRVRCSTLPFASTKKAVIDSVVLLHLNKFCNRSALLNRNAIVLPNTTQI